MDPIERLNWIGKVTKSTNGNLAAMAVAMQIAPMINSKLGYAYPSLTYMVKESGLSMNTIVRGIKTLESSGLLSIERDHRKVNKYRLITKVLPGEVVAGQQVGTASLGSRVLPDEAVKVLPGEVVQSRISNRVINKGPNRGGSPMLDNIIISMEDITGKEPWEAIREAPWFLQLKAGRCIVTKDNWLEWYGLICDVFKGDPKACADAAKELSKDERWPDKVEKYINPPKEKITTEMVGNRLRELMCQRCTEVYVKNAVLVAHAQEYGWMTLVDLSEHARQLGDGLSADLFSYWFKGRESPHGGWDYYSPKKMIEKSMSIEEVYYSIDEEYKPRRIAAAS